MKVYLTKKEKKKKTRILLIEIWNTFNANTLRTKEICLWVCWYLRRFVCSLCISFCW